MKKILYLLMLLSSFLPVMWAFSDTADISVKTIYFSQSSNPYTIITIIQRLPGGSTKDVSFDVSVYDGTPATGIKLNTVKNQKLSYINPGAPFSRELQIDTTWRPALDGSTHTIYVVIEPKNYTDTNSANNTAYVSKQVASPPLPPVPGEDIGIKGTPTVQFNNSLYTPQYTITTTVRRLSVYPNLDKATFVEVTCYNNSMSPANKISSSSGWIPNPQATTAPEKTLSVDWYPVLDNSTHDIWIEVKVLKHAGHDVPIYTDPDPTNNVVKIQITLPAPPPPIVEDLAVRVLPSQIEFDGTAYLIGAQVQILNYGPPILPDWSQRLLDLITFVKVAHYDGAITPVNRIGVTDVQLSRTHNGVRLFLRWVPAAIENVTHDIWIEATVSGHTTPSYIKFVDPDMTNNVTKVQINPFMGGTFTEDVCFYHCDSLGTPLAMTDLQGRPVWSGNSLPFGERFDGAGSRDTELMYAGKHYDHQLKLYDLGARHYSPETGRFTGIDPARGNLANPQSLNKYVYVLNNPYKYVDPTGNKEEDINYTVTATNSTAHVNTATSPKTVMSQGALQMVLKSIELQHPVLAGLKNLETPSITTPRPEAQITTPDTLGELRMQKDIAQFKQAFAWMYVSINNLLSVIHPDSETDPETWHEAAITIAQTTHEIKNLDAEIQKFMNNKNETDRSAEVYLSTTTVQEVK
jgi:RHS repeat-associated protein